MIYFHCWPCEIHKNVLKKKETRELLSRHTKSRRRASHGLLYTLFDNLQMPDPKFFKYYGMSWSTFYKILDGISDKIQNIVVIWGHYYKSARVMRTQQFNSGKFSKNTLQFCRVTCGARNCWKRLQRCFVWMLSKG